MLNNTNKENTAIHNVLNTLVHISFPYVFIVSLIGIGGNILTIFMMAKRSIAKNFNTCTLIALALTDLVFNFTLMSRCIIDLSQLNSEQLCRLLSFLSHLAELLSACFTAQFTAQRFVAVRFPLSVFVEKKIHLIHYLIVSVFILFGVTYCLLLVRTNEYDGCHEELELNWFISDALSSFAVPFTIIAALNLLIIFNLKKRYMDDQQYRFSTRRHLSQFSAVHSAKISSSTHETQLDGNFSSNIYDNISMSNSRV